MTTAFVLSGGGSLGAVQVGMLQALGERGVVPDLLVGTSAGAINAAFVGGHGMPPLWPLKVSAADFSHADELIARAKKATGWRSTKAPICPSQNGLRRRATTTAPAALLRAHRI